MSKHTFSAFTSDIRRNPGILVDLQHAAAASTKYLGNLTITTDGDVTTVEAVAA